MATETGMSSSSSSTSSSAKTTTDHEEIRRWVDSRGGRPACVRGTGGQRDTGMLRIDFPGYSGAETLQEISWDEWLRAFDENDLEFLYQDDGYSRFNKLVARSTAAASGGGSSGGRAAGGGRRGGAPL